GTLQLHTAAGRACLRIAGDWTLAHYATLRDAVARMRPQLGADSTVELEQLGALDTAGVGLLVELLGAQRIAEVAQWAPQLPAERLALLRTVATALARPDVAQPRAGYEFGDLLAHIGRTMQNLWQQQRELLGFIGLTLQTLLTNLARPRRWRLTALVAHIEQTGLNAIPI